MERGGGGSAGGGGAGDDIFEDFASDASDVDNDGDYASGDFDDDHIANVLELMDDEGGRQTATLSAITEEEDSGELSPDTSAAHATDGANGTGRHPVTRRAAATRALAVPRASASEIPSAMSLLDELFPSLDPLALLATESTVSPSKREGVARHEPASLLQLGAHFVEPSLHYASDEKLRPTRQEDPSLQSSALHKPPSNSPARDDQEQPEWMRELLDEMYKQSTSPRAAKVPVSAAFKDADEVAEGERVSDSVSPHLPNAVPGLSPPAAPTSGSQEEIFSPSSSELPLPREDPPVLQVDSMFEQPASPHRSVSGEPSLSSSLDGNASWSSLTWGKFTPDKMPARQASSEPLTLGKTGGGARGTGGSKRLCYVPMPRSQRRRPRVMTPAEAELTFRPMINARYLARLHSRRTILGEAFARRMATDIQQRQERQIERAKKLDERTQQAEQEQTRRKSLIAKGSERILQRNGLWEEPLEKRLERLVLGNATQTQRGSAKASEKSRLRQQKRRQRAEAVASQACESLYQRGLDKKRRAERRELEDAESLRVLRARRKITARSRLVIKEKLRAELERVCASRRQHASLAPGDGAKSSASSSATDSERRVTFVEFSCALLYFGLVPELETRWRGDERVTLLWHAWRCFVGLPSDSDDSEDGRSEDHPDSEQTLAMSTLEGILARVMRVDEREAGGDTQRLHQKQRREHSSDKGDRELLLQLLRANYLSRKRSRTLEMRCMYDSALSSAVCRPPPPGRQQQQQTRDATRASRRTYSLHGKPVETASDDPLLQRQRATAARLSALRREKERLEVAECTFRPRVSASPARASAWSCNLRLLSASGRQYQSATAATFDRLYNDAFQRQNNVLDRYLQAKLEEDERRKQLAAVSPGFAHGQSIEERLGSLQRALASTPLPANFHKTIDAMRSASELKARERAARAKRLQPVHFARSADGRTVVVPFQLATDLRAAQAPRLRVRGAEAADRELRMKATRAAVRSAVSTLHSDDGDWKRVRVRCPAPQPGDQQQQQKEEEEEDAEGADFCLDVHLSPSRVRQLYFSAHDDPAALAAAFGARFRLVAGQQRALERVVRTHLEELLDLEL